MPAGAAKELTLRFSVGFLDMPTSKTALAGATWINHVYPNAIQFCFVGDKEPKLSESPIAAPCPFLSALNPRPRSDAVVHVGLKPMLFASQFLQMAFGGQRAALLQISTQALMFMPLAFNRGAGHRVASLQ